MRVNAGLTGRRTGAGRAAGEGGAMLALMCGIAVAIAASSAFSADFAAADMGSGTWSVMLSEFVRSIDVTCFISLIILVVAIGLAVDALLHIRVGRFIPDDILGVVQEEMANGEYEKALDACVKSDSLAGQVFAAALSKTDYSFERMEGAMKVETQILGLIWRQWVGQFRLLAFLGIAAGMIGALLNVMRLIADLPGRTNPALIFASSFEMRSLLYSIFGVLLIGALTAVVSMLMHHFCRARLERILLEADRLGEELLDPFRPLPAGMDGEAEE